MKDQVTGRKEFKGQNDQCVRKHIGTKTLFGKVKYKYINAPGKSPFNIKPDRQNLMDLVDYMLSKGLPIRLLKYLSIKFPRNNFIINSNQH